MEKQIKKIIPLAALYLGIILLLIRNLEYELIITITTAILLAVYTLTKNKKFKMALKYILLAAVLALVVYLVKMLIQDYHWFFLCQKIYYNETKWAIFRWNGYFIGDFKYLAYIGAILLAIKWNEKS